MIDDLAELIAQGMWTTRHHAPEAQARCRRTESFEPKSKFPPNLKAPVHTIAVKALELGQYSDDFFQAMADIFPYNLFTMKVSFYLAV